MTDWKIILQADDHALLIGPDGDVTCEVWRGDEGTDDDDEPGLLYRFPVERFRVVPGPHVINLSTGPTEGPHAHDHVEWFSRDLVSIARSCGWAVNELRDLLCHENPAARLCGYLGLIGYHSVENLDGYPTPMRRDEWEAWLLTLPEVG